MHGTVCMEMPQSNRHFWMMLAGGRGGEWHCRKSKSYVQIKALEDDILVRS